MEIGIKSERVIKFTQERNNGNIFMKKQYDKNYSLALYSDVFEKSRKVFRANGMSVAQGINLFLRSVAINGEASIPSEEELDREELFQEIQTMIKQGISEYEKGNCVSLEEVKKEFGL